MSAFPKTARDPAINNLHEEIFIGGSHVLFPRPTQPRNAGFSPAFRVACASTQQPKLENSRPGCEGRQASPPVVGRRASSLSIHRQTGGTRCLPSQAGSLFSNQKTPN